MKSLSTKSSIAIVFLMAFLFITFFVWTTYSNIDQTRNESRKVKSDLLVLAVLKNVQKDLQVVEGLQDIYINTSKDSLLELYSKAIANFSADTFKLIKIELFDSVKKAEILQLKNLLANKINNSREVVALYTRGGGNATIEKTKLKESELIADAISKSIINLENKGSLLITAPNTQIETIAQHTASRFFMLAFIFLFILLLFFYTISNDLKKEQKASAKFRYQASLIDSISDAIIGTNDAFIITGWNKHAEEMYGYTKEEALGKSIRLLQLEIKGNEYNTSLAELKAKGNYKDEFNAFTKSGTPIFISASITTLKDNDHVITGYIAVHRDISARIKLENELKHFNQTLELQVKEKTTELTNIFERITDGFLVLNSNLDFTYVNNKAGKILGYKPDSMIGKNIWTGFPESANTIFNEACLKSLETQEYEYLENYYQPLDIWIENYIYPSPDGISVFFKDSTYKKEAELALKLSEHNYKQLIENLHSGVVVHKADASVTLYNQAAANLLGLTEPHQGKLITEADWNFISEDGKKLESAKYPVAQVLAGNKPIQNFILGICRLNNKGQVWVLTNAFPVLDANMQIKEVVVTFVDITERKKVEEELKISEEKFRSLVENAPDTIISADLQGKIQFINIAGGGYTKEQIIGSSLYNFVSPEYFGIVKQTHQKVIESKQHGYYETVSVGMDGISRWFLTNVGPIFLNDEVVGITLITKDITERKNVEEETKLREEALNKAQRIAKIGNWELNTNTNELTWSKEQYRIFELENHSMQTLYQAYKNKLKPANATRFEMAVAHAIKTGEGYTLEYGLTCNDGSTKNILVISETVKDTGGNVIGLKGISQDITERKNAEQLLQKSFDQIQLLAKLSKAVSHAEIPIQIYELALDALLQTIDADNAAVLLFDETGVGQLVASKGLSKEYKALANVYLPWDRNEKNAHSVFIPNVETDPSLSTLLPSLIKEGIVSMGFIPLVYQGYLMGSFMVYFKQGHFFTKEETQLVETIARDVAFAISEKKSAIELLSSRQKYKLLFDNNPMPMWMLSLPDRNFIDVNEAAVSRYGYGREEFLKMNVLDIRPAEDIEPFKQTYTNPTNGERNQGVWRHRKKNGSVIKVEIIAHDILYEGKNVRLILANDVDEKLKSEERLQNSYKEIRQLATHLQNIREEERTNIAREIHDELGQQLTGLKMYISWLSKKIQPQEEEIKDRFASTIELIDDTVRTVRKISTELRPSMLDDLGLIAAMEWQSSEFEKRSGIQTEFINLTENKSIPLKLNTGLFRIFQESLTNVARHANAKKIISTMEIKDGIISLTIADDGKGFIVEEIGSKKTLGLFGMKERTMVMGGTYEIKSEPGKGAIVSVKVPVS